MANGARGFLGRLVGGVCSVVISSAFIACSADQKHPSPVETAFNNFDQFQMSVARSDPTARVLVSKIDNRYLVEFAPYQTKVAIAQLDNHDVSLLFRAADLAFFYTISAPSLHDMRLDLAELHRRGIARKENDEQLYAALLESRSFAEARAFSKLHPTVASAQTVPEVVDHTGRAGPTTLLVRDGGKKLERRSVDLRNGRRIVVVASPLCHFCQRAIRSIEKDALLLALFRDHALWLVPPDESTPFSTVATWNRLHPNEQMEYAYRREEWPMVERWETPAFYFVNGGRVVSIVSGWPVAGRKAEIIHGLKLAGLT